MRKITITVESLRNEIEYLEDLKQGFINESNRAAAIRTQRTINFKKEQLMKLLKSDKKEMEIRV